MFEDIIKKEKIENLKDFPGKNFKGLVTNCFIKARNGEFIFYLSSEGIYPKLDGYAIIPIEDYKKLK
jgi:hypothetical protein